MQEIVGRQEVPACDGLVEGGAQRQRAAVLFALKGAEEGIVKLEREVVAGGGVGRRAAGEGGAAKPALPCGDVSVIAVRIEGSLGAEVGVEGW